MKAKLLTDAGEISEGTVVEIASKAGMNDSRTDEDVGGRSTADEPVYEVTDTEGHAEKVARFIRSGVRRRCGFGLLAGPGGWSPRRRRARCRLG